MVQKTALLRPETKNMSHLLGPANRFKRSSNWQQTRLAGSGMWHGGMVASIVLHHPPKSSG